MNHPKKKVLLTGATGYIGMRLLPMLVQNGFHVVCCVRDAGRFHPAESLKEHIEIIEADVLNRDSLDRIPKDISAAFYLIHSMAATADYKALELKSAINFREAIEQTGAEQVIYLGGIVNQNALSEHLDSRLNVERELGKGDYAFTALRAGIIIGSGSASFEIIRDLVEKLPVMITPKWLHTKCQPIAVSDVLSFLSGCLLNFKTYNSHFDIGGTDVLSYRQMLLGYAEVRGLKRHIAVVPVMTPKLSSYWLYFITSTSYKLATALVDSMKIEVVCTPNPLAEMLKIQPVGCLQALQRTFSAIEENQVVSSWKDAFASGELNFKLSDFMNVPVNGCFTDQRTKSVRSRAETVERIWRIGGDRGWYYGNWLWKLRGFIDLLAGGVGLRRGRTHPKLIDAGDAIDFWRVLYANQDEGRLLLFAEMKLPGEAWLEFKIDGNQLIQTATFRPKGVWGRIYWYAVLPFHGFIFDGMAGRLSR